jgi:hypothetical protein
MIQTDGVEPSGWVRLVHTYPVDRCFDLPRYPDYLDLPDTLDGCFFEPTNMGLMLKVTRYQRDEDGSDEDSGAIDVMIWGAQVEPSACVGPYIPAIQTPTSCAYEIPLRHDLSDYYVGSTGQVAFKMRLPFQAEIEDGETLCTLTGFNADRSRKMRIAVFLEAIASCSSPDSAANVVLLVEHKAVTQSDSDLWELMGSCDVDCELLGTEENTVVIDWDFRPVYYDGINEERAWLRLSVNDSEAILTLANTAQVDVVCDFIAEYFNISGQTLADGDFPADKLPRALFYDVVVSAESTLSDIIVPS